MQSNTLIAVNTFIVTLAIVTLFVVFWKWSEKFEVEQTQQNLACIEQGGSVVSNDCLVLKE